MLLGAAAGLLTASPLIESIGWTGFLVMHQCVLAVGTASAVALLLLGVSAMPVGLAIHPAPEAKPAYDKILMTSSRRHVPEMS